jgi:Alpha-glucuronidase
MFNEHVLMKVQHPKLLSTLLHSCTPALLSLLLLSCVGKAVPPDNDGHSLWLRDSLNVKRYPLNPSSSLILLNHWDNPDGTIERGYAGHSIWRWDELPDSVSSRYAEYARACASIGINGTVLNNVNAKPIMLTSAMLTKAAVIASELRPYGIRVFLSVNFATPQALGELPTADPLDSRVGEWWKQKVSEIYSLIPDFGGFLVKANSEGEPGPMDFGRTHADGANLLADALAPYGGIVMWRAFVYAPNSPDRACQAYDEFMPLDGQFRDNVILQVKNGPVDFQPREPLSPLLFSMKHTRVMPELQITQEYLGQSIHTVFLAVQWSEFFKSLQASPKSSPEGEDFKSPLLQEGKGEAIAGVANIGDDTNWCGSDMAQANWYAFGRLAQDPTLSPAQIAREWLTKTFTADPRFVEPMTDVLLRSYEAAVDYMMPMGLHHLFAWGHHYGPEPWCSPRGARPDWTPPYYHRADSLGIGFDRTLQGSGAVAQYGDSLCALYNDPLTCPEEYILWFHHLPWTFTRPDWKDAEGHSQNLWQRLCWHYDRGVREAEYALGVWQKMMPYVDNLRYERQLQRFRQQAMDARWWRDACLLYFATFSRQPLPADSPAPTHSLDSLMRFHLPISNYEPAPFGQR